MDRKQLEELISKWRTEKLKGFIYDANKTELEIIELARNFVIENIYKYSDSTIQLAIMKIEDIFTAYYSMREEAPRLNEKKLLLISDIKGLKIKSQKWGLSEQEQASLLKKVSQVEDINTKLNTFNHLVNFNVPESMQLYFEVSDEKGLEVLLEVYKFIDEKGFEKLVKERKETING